MANIERLTRLAEALDAWEPNEKVKHFHMTRWFYNPAIDYAYDVTWFEESTGDHYHKCGTTACAVGYAATLPQFQKEGLCIFDDESPYFEGYKGWNAVTAFFEIRFTEAFHLFDSEKYLRSERSDPKAVAARIREFINEQP